MMSHIDSHAELTSLLSDLIEDGLTPTQSERLGQILEADAAARAIYRDHVSMHAMLHWRWHQKPSAERRPSTGEQIARSMMGASTIQNSDTASPASATRSASIPLAAPPPFPVFESPQFFSAGFHGTVGYFASGGWPVAYLVTTVLFGIGLVVGAIVHVSEPANIAQHRDSPNSSLESPFSSAVARITGMVDCVWEARGKGVDSPVSNQKSEIINQKSMIHLGDHFALSSGILEITYDSGAKVILQGPSTYDVDSAAGGYLSVGKLTARLDKKVASGRESSSPQPLAPSPFVITTPTATVIDIGTEFGVEVRASGETSAHVFRGVIEVQPVTVGHMPQGHAIRLVENESLQVEKPTSDHKVNMHRGTVDTAAFVRVEQLPRIAEQRRLGPFRRWQAYSDQLRKDPSLVAYYDFQQRSDGYLGLLRNSAASGDASRDGSIAGAAWTSGRMPGKQAIQFRGPSDYISVTLPQKVDDLTLAAWVYIDAMKDEYSSLLMSDFTTDGQVAWQVGRDRQVCFHVAGASEAAYRSSPVFDTAHLCRWSHLAVVLDHVAGHVRFYLDGQLTDEARLKKHVPVCIGQAMIGHWSLVNPMRPRSLQGRIDELAIFGRPLTSAEVHRMFEAGRPKHDAKSAHGE